MIILPSLASSVTAFQLGNITDSLVERLKLAREHDAKEKAKEVSVTARAGI